MAMFVGSGGGENEDGGYAPMAEINITPMVDVMLVLLVIFMVAAPLMMAGVPVELPQTTAARVSNPQKPMIVSVTPDGGVYIRDDQVPEDALVSRLRALREKEGDTVVYVRADKTSNYGKVMDVLGKVGQSGYGRVSLLTKPQGGGSDKSPAE